MTSSRSLNLFIIGTLRVTYAAQQPANQQSTTSAVNPVIRAALPEISGVTNGDMYCMSSTMMHMSRKVPLMKFKDLVNLGIVTFAFETPESTDIMNLNCGSNDCGIGSFSCSLGLNNGTRYVSTFSRSTGKTFIRSTGEIENSPWKTISFNPCHHENTLFFEEAEVILQPGLNQEN